MDYEEIVRRYLPRNWTLKYSYKRAALCRATEKFYLGRGHVLRRAPASKSMGLANFDTKTIYGPRPTCPFTLHVVLHEIAHARLHTKSRRPMHREEFEADRWAQAIMRLEGVPVTRAIRRGMARYTMTSILEDEKIGERIERHVAAAVRNHWPKRWPAWVFAKGYATAPTVMRRLRKRQT